MANDTNGQGHKKHYDINYSITQVIMTWHLAIIKLFDMAFSDGLWSGRSEVQISGRSNRTQCCQRLATAATFLRKELCCPGATTRRWAPQTRYTLRRTTASINERFDFDNGNITLIQQQVYINICKVYTANVDLVRRCFFKGYVI